MHWMLTVTLAMIIFWRVNFQPKGNFVAYIRQKLLHQLCHRLCFFHDSKNYRRQIAALRLFSFPSSTAMKLARPMPTQLSLRNTGCILIGASLLTSKCFPADVTTISQQCDWGWQCRWTQSIVNQRQRNVRSSQLAWIVKHALGARPTGTGI